MTTTLRTLLDRVEQGEGADREIDALLDVAFDLRPSFCVGDKGKLIAHSDGYVQVSKGGPSWCSPLYASSIDAAVYLVEKVLPGWKYGFESDRELEKRFVGSVWKDGAMASTLEQSMARTPARAILAALLRAKIAQEERT